MKNPKQLIWLSGVSLAYLPNVVLWVILMFGYTPDLPTAHATKKMIEFVAIVLPIVGLILAGTSSLILKYRLRDTVYIVLGWPFYFGFFIFLHRFTYDQLNR